MAKEPEPLAQAYCAHQIFRVAKYLPRGSCHWGNIMCLGRMQSREASLLGSKQRDTCSRENPGGESRQTKASCPTVQKQGWGGKPPLTVALTFLLAKQEARREFLPLLHAGPSQHLRDEKLSLWTTQVAASTCRGLQALRNRERGANWLLPEVAFPQLWPP